MRRSLIMLALVSLLATASPGAPGQPLPPGADHRNDTQARVFVLLDLAPDAAFTNTTDATFRVLTARELRAVADAAADPQVIAHEDTIERLQARLAELDAALAGHAAERDRLQEDTP